MQRTRISRPALLLPLLALLTVPLWGQTSTTEKHPPPDTTLPEVIWRDPGEPGSLNLLYGAGGDAHAPDPNGTYIFVKEDLDGTTPKFEVEDQAGTRWRVKLGEESQPETASTRLLWAAGYFVDEDYYLPEIKVTGLPATLKRGQKLVLPGGVLRGAGMERGLNVTKLSDWDWADNPFRGTRELNGLRVMMALLNNWDVKVVNNSIYQTDTERRYAVSDIGATFGNTGNFFTRSKSSLSHYADSKFIEETEADTVDFDLNTRPFALLAVRVNYYRKYTRMEDTVRDIPRADARWLGQRLSLLSGEQLRDCFKAAGYSPEEVEGYTQIVRKRIEALNAL